MIKNCLVALLLTCTLGSFAQDYKFGKVSKAELEEKFYPLDSTVNAAYLYRKRRTYFNYNDNEGFQVITEVQERIKIYNKEGVDEGNISIGYYKPDSGSKESVVGIKGYTFNLKNGKVVKEKLAKKQIFQEQRSKFTSVKKLAMPSVGEGSVIEISYKRILPFWSIRELQFQFNIPIKKLECAVTIPEYFVFNKKAKGYYFPKMTETKVNGSIGSGSNVLAYINTQYAFDGVNVPAVKDDEVYVVNINNYRGGMKFELVATRFPNSAYKNYATNWEDVCKQINESSYFGDELKKSNYYQDDLTTILASASTDLEKTGAIYNHVKSKVKWNEDSSKYTDKGVKKAYKEGVGNSAEINLILISMLRSAGLNANPVLVSTKSNGVPFFPTLNGFDYVIAMVEFPEGGYVLLDGTEPYAKPNILPVMALNWNGRKVTKDGKSSWVNLVPSQLSTENHIMSMKISDDGEVEGNMRSTYNNYVALGFRKKASRLSEDELIAELEEDYAVETEGFKIDNQNDLGKPVVRSFKFFGEDFVEGVNDKLYLNPMLFLATTKNPFKAEKRTFPVEYVIPWQDKHRITLDLPEGYTIESLPEKLSIGLPDNLGSFRFLIQQQGNKVTVLSILRMNSAVITPEYYGDLKEFYNKLVAKQSEKIVLVKS